MSIISLSIVVPVYNEAGSIPEFSVRITQVLEDMSTRFSLLKEALEVVCVNDGSTDESLSLLLAQNQADPRFKVVNLSRNFGHQAALSAGIDVAKGEFVVVIDADLQDPPETIPTLYETSLKGFDVVYAVRAKREGESWFKKVTAHLFYRLLRKLSPFPIPTNTGDFRLMSRRVVNVLKRMPERHRFIRGMVSFIGFPQIGVLYHRQPRSAGETSYTLVKMLRLAADAITSFSALPLRVTLYLGFGVAGLGFLYAFDILYEKLFKHTTLPGWSSLMVVVLTLGGAQLIFLGLIGEYLGRVHDESKQRPLYIIESETP